MAGSYDHCLNKETGKFVGDDDQARFYGMIENLGDAYEACEQMFDMIEYLSRKDPFVIEAAEHYHLRKRYPHHVNECELCKQVKP